MATGDSVYHKYASNYLEVRNDPLYPFGYGLSYTTFAYGEPVMSAPTMALNGSVDVRMRVTNTGACRGVETVQLYLRDPVALISRPVKELKGFRRVELAPGESREVTFTITPELLQYYDGNGVPHLEPGRIDVMVGPNSRDLHSTHFDVIQ